MKQIKIEWCENFIRKTFEKYAPYNIEVNCFWDMAEKSGLWLRGTYGSPMSKALSKLVGIGTKSNESGDFLYNYFYLKGDTCNG